MSVIFPKHSHLIPDEWLLVDCSNQKGLRKRHVGRCMAPSGEGTTCSAMQPTLQATAILTPISGQHGSPTPEVTFNFFQSSKRMAIECVCASFRHIDDKHYYIL